jgi:UTP-glucose-1-phosphate uridylyltransferase
MLPLIDKDGLVKPAILILLEQLITAGIEEICLVVGTENDIHTYRDFFNNSLEKEHYSKLSKKLQNYEKSIYSIGEKISFRVQRSRLGFGHAVYQCNDFSAGEPVLLLSGDTLYTSSNILNCTQQLINMYEVLEKPLIAIHRIPLEQTCHYGILSGTWLDDSHTKMEITNFIEKPEQSYAENNLSMSSEDGVKEYYAVFGQYIIPPEIFNKLNYFISDEQNHSAELDMTGALRAFIGKGLTGVVLDGTMYDIGNPEAYLKTFSYFNSTL